MTQRIRTSKKYARELANFLGEHAFLLTLFLIAFAAGISALVFFLSVLSREPKDTAIQSKAVELRQDVFEKILEARSIQNERVRDSKISLPKDMFRLNR